MKNLLIGSLMVAWACTLQAASADGVIERETRLYDRGEIKWYPWAKPEQIKENAINKNCCGWVEFDVEVPKAQWYEFWQMGVVPEWTRDFYLDGNIVRYNYRVNSKTDFDDKDRKWMKDFNIFLTQGRHTLRLRRLSFPGSFSRRWKLVPAGDNPQGTIYVSLPESAVRVGEDCHLTVEGGANRPTAYDVATISIEDGTTNVLGSVSFPASAQPIRKDVTIRLPKEGVYDLLLIGRDQPKGVRARRSDAGSVRLAAVEMTPPPRPKELKRTLVADIDCVKEAPYREKDGATRIVRKDFGAYRESSGNASDAHWALDGFSYQAFLPDDTSIYQLVVDYPDDAFRSVGFWTTDGVVRNEAGIVLTGGVETGLQYRNTNTMLTHEAFFYPQATNVVVAALNLNQGSRAAASRIRIYRVDGELPAAEPHVSRGRLIGNFFEEYGRWKRHFGMRPSNGDLLLGNMRSMENWAKWNSFSGYNMMHPAVVAYSNVLYPSRELQGQSHVAEVNEMRILALYAEKYGNAFIPHVTVKENAYIARMLGVHVDTVVTNGQNVTVLSYETPEAKDLVCVNRKGMHGISWTSYIFNALHPKVQEKFINIIGETADRLKGVKSFTGLCVRVPISWQFNGMMGLNYGDMDYGDWTIATFERETGIKVPGEADDPARYETRYQFLMGPQKEAWLNWRARKMHDYFKRILARIQSVKPDAKLYVMWWGQTERMKETGFDLELFRDEKDIAFLTSGKNYGRRYFTPLGNARNTGIFGNPEEYASSQIGLRACEIDGDYYEVNSRMKWEELGVQKAIAFDACAPAGVNELEHFALALAKADVTTISTGGNGWMFGTPRIQGPFVREYESLPTERFDLCPVGANDPVTVRVHHAKDGLWFYAVNLLDVPVKVEIDVKDAGRVTGTVDGRETPTKLTLSPYGLKGFFAARGASGKRPSIVAVRTDYDRSAFTPMAACVTAAKALRTKLAARQVAVELTEEMTNKALAILDQVVRDAAAGKVRAVRDGLRRKELMYVYELMGSYPEAAFGETSPRGSYPRNTARFPRLSLAKIVGGDPYAVGANEPCAFSAAGDSLYVATASARDHAVSIREFGRDGTYRRSGRLTVFDPARQINTGDCRNGFQVDPTDAAFGAIDVADGILHLQTRKGGAHRYSLETFRQLPDELGVTHAFPTPARPKEIALKAKVNPLSRALSRGTQLKVQDGKVWFLETDALCSIDPQTDVIRKEVPLKGVSGPGAFAFDAEGNLFVAGSHGGKVTLYRAARNGAGYGAFEPLNDGKPIADAWYLTPSDLAVTADGKILTRTGAWTQLELSAFKDGELASWGALGARDFRQSNRYGFHVCRNGDVVVAGGGTRKVARYAADGTLKWERRYIKDGRKETFPVRAPIAVTEDGAGRLWIVDTARDELVCTDADGTFLGRFGHSATLDDRTGAGFSAPSGIAAIGKHLYVADLGNRRLVKLTID